MSNKIPESWMQRQETIEGARKVYPPKVNEGLERSHEEVVVINPYKGLSEKSQDPAEQLRLEKAAEERKRNILENRRKRAELAAKRREVQNMPDDDENKPDAIQKVLADMKLFNKECLKKPENFYDDAELEMIEERK